MPQCSTCGSSVSEQDRVCPDCGMEMGATTPPVNPQGVVSLPSTPSSAAPVNSPQQSPISPPVAPPEPVAARPRLTLRRAGELTSDIFPLGERVTIGRFDVETGPVDVDLGPLPEGAYLSRHHAEMWRDGSGKWFIKDLGSQNGTFVRSDKAMKFQRVTADQPISAGDEIAFGNARFEFQTA